VEKIKEFFFNLFFPKFCLICRREGSYLCEDCFSLIDLCALQEKKYCPFCHWPLLNPQETICLKCQRKNYLNDLEYAAFYDNFVVKKLINQFKYKPYLKDLAKTIAFLIILHLILKDKLNHFKNFILIPIPLHKKRLKQRGYNQAKEIAKEISFFLKTVFAPDVLIKTKNTPSQVNLKKEEREKNVINSFSVSQTKKILNKKILLIDDVMTTGATLKEAARVLKRAGADKISAIVIAKG